MSGDAKLEYLLPAERARFEHDLAAGKVTVFRQGKCELCDKIVPLGTKYCSRLCHDAVAIPDRMAEEDHGDQG